MFSTNILGLCDQAESSENSLSPAKSAQRILKSHSTEATSKPLEESKRTPIYRFVWGSQVYLQRCFIAKLNYKLTLFLPDGTPVRAVIDSLTLKKADEEKPSTDLKQAIVDRVRYDLQAGLQASARLRM